MRKVSYTELTFEEELAAAIYFNNVEKIKWLVAMDCFKPEMLTEPKMFDDKMIPLYWITLCYKYMSRYSEFAGEQKKVNEILSIWKDKFNLDTERLIDIYEVYPEEKQQKNHPTGSWVMGEFTKETFIRSGARDVDFKLYLAVCNNDLQKIQDCLNQGALPDAKVITDKGTTVSTLSLYRRIHTNRDDYFPRKEYPLGLYEVPALFRSGCAEMILYLLETNIKNRKQTPVDTFDGELKKFDIFDGIQVPSDMKKKIDDFVTEIDHPGAVLAVFDEGKVFANPFVVYLHAYQYLTEKILKDSKHILIRVGGYSDRVSHLVLNTVERLQSQPDDRVYVEYLCEMDDYSSNFNFDPRIKVYHTQHYNFTPDMDIVRRAEEYDFKSFSGSTGSHTMVYYYVNNISTGWYEKDGNFFPFYDNSRGLQAIDDVIMLNGYNEIKPATAVVCTFTFDTTGDTIIAGNTMHKDTRSRISSQRKLIEASGVKLLDLTADDISIPRPTKEELLP